MKYSDFLVWTQGYVEGTISEVTVYMHSADISRALPGKDAFDKEYMLFSKSEIVYLEFRLLHVPCYCK